MAKRKPDDKAVSVRRPPGATGATPLKKGRKPPEAPTPEKQAEFLSLLREGRTVESAARNIGIHRNTLYLECG